MAGEIIALERSKEKQQFAFLYTVPGGSIIEIGGTGATGKYPVLTPAPTDPDDPLYIVLTAQERLDLDAGTKVLRRFTLTVPDSMTDPQVLALAQGAYDDLAAASLAMYTDKYKYIGRRFDKS